MLLISKLLPCICNKTIFIVNHIIKLPKSKRYLSSYANIILIFSQVIFINLYSSLNINKLELLGAGTQGKVYKIDSYKCIKIF